MRELLLKPLVGRTAKETALRLYGRVLFLRHRPNDVRVLMRLLHRRHRLCVVLPAGAPWPWLEFWAREAADSAAARLSIHFDGTAERARDAR